MGSMDTIEFICLLLIDLCLSRRGVSCIVEKSLQTLQTQCVAMLHSSPRVSFIPSFYRLCAQSPNGLAR